MQTGRDSLLIAVGSDACANTVIDTATEAIVQWRNNQERQSTNHGLQWRFPKSNEPRDGATVREF